MSTSNFVITKAILEGYCSRGFTAIEMAAEITTVSGKKCSVNKVKDACEYYGISLKHKPRKSGFEFEPIEKEVTTPIQVEAVSTVIPTGELVQTNMLDVISEQLAQNNSTPSNEVTEEEKFLNPTTAVTV